VFNVIVLAVLLIVNIRPFRLPPDEEGAKVRLFAPPIDELAVKINGLVTVPDKAAVACSAPPPSVKGPVPNAVLLPNTNVPAVTVTPPV